MFACKRQAAFRLGLGDETSCFWRSGLGWVSWMLKSKKQNIVDDFKVLLIKICRNELKIRYQNMRLFFRMPLVAFTFYQFPGIHWGFEGKSN
jgi:hypothetical protein